MASNMGERPSPPRIFTDSTASLPPELARINGIGIVAAAVIFSKERNGDVG